MLNAIVRFSVRFRGVVIALACLLTAYGLQVAWRSKFDVFPDFLPPQVVIQTEAPGLSPEEVELAVTRPVELAVNGAGGLLALRSQSIQGLSVVTATFRDGTGIHAARQQVAERLAELGGRLPAGAGAPRMAPLTSAASLILACGLTSSNRTLMELRTEADFVVTPRLLSVPGVAKVSVFGGEVRQLQVQVDPGRLRQFDVALDEVVAAARRATGQRGGGFAEGASQRIILRSAGGALTPEQLGETVVARRGGASLRLREVAAVVAGAAPAAGAAAIMGRPGIQILVSSQPGANTLEVTAAVEQALAELQPVFAARGITLHAALFRPASFIAAALANVRFSLLLGGALVLVVLLLFLADWRTAAISFTAIPLSLLGAVILLDRLGCTLNTLTLGGLAIAIGEVVDDAIIDVENILRRLRLNAASPAPRPALPVVLEASLEVRCAVVYATFVVVLVFAPVLAMSGLQGRLFAPLGLAYILAILASLAVALTVTPALALAWFRRRLPAGREPRHLAGLKHLYGGLLAKLLARPRMVLGLAAAAASLAVAALPFFGGAFLPELREGHFIVHMAAVPGTSLAESLRLGQAVTAELLRNPHLRSVAQRVGRAELADDTWGPHYSELDVALNPLSGAAGENVLEELRAALGKFPGVNFAIKTFLTERIEETISGSAAEVAIKLFGEDLDQLDADARAVASLVGGIRGAVDVQLESPPGAPQEVIRLRPDRLRAHGLQPASVLEAMETAYQGTVVGQVFDGGRVFEVAVILEEPLRRRPENVGGLPLRNPEGALVPLRAVADIYPGAGRHLITHEGARRRQVVTCNVRGRAAGSFTAELRRKIPPLLGGKTYARVEGVAEAGTAARREFLLHSLLAGAGIVLLLSMAFQRARHLVLVLANLPFALVGGVLAIFATGGQLSVGALVGLVTLFGISTRNSIMLVAHYEHLVSREGCPWSLETARRGAVERCVPILMTALVTALGLAPIAASFGRPGQEIESPMAVVILAGLVTSTLLNLLVLPTLALRYGRFAKAPAAES